MNYSWNGASIISSEAQIQGVTRSSWCKSIDVVTRRVKWKASKGESVVWRACSFRLNASSWSFLSSQMSDDHVTSHTRVLFSQRGTLERNRERERERGKGSRLFLGAFKPAGKEGWRNDEARGYSKSVGGRMALVWMLPLAYGPISTRAHNRPILWRKAKVAVTTLCANERIAKPSLVTRLAPFVSSRSWNEPPSAWTIFTLLHPPPSSPILSSATNWYDPTDGCITRWRRGQWIWKFGKMFRI